MDVLLAKSETYTSIDHGSPENEGFDSVGMGLCENQLLGPNRSRRKSRTCAYARDNVEPCKSASGPGEVHK